MSILISAIVCTHNPREDFIQRVLHGLQCQTLSKSNWEIIVVDSASQQPVAERIDLTWHPNAKIVREAQLGLTPARLRGISEAIGDYLVFVDDDTVLSADYLQQCLEIGNEWTHVGAWGGCVTPEYEQPLPVWIGSEVWRLTVVDVKEDVWSNLRDNFSTFPVGAGMCIRKCVGVSFSKWCQFSKHSLHLDRSGNSLTGYGDVDLAYCALDIGLGTGRSRRLKLTHLIPATRLTLDYFLRHAEGDAASLILFLSSRGLSIKKNKKAGLWRTIITYLYAWRNRRKMEHVLIQAAHFKGLLKGEKLLEKTARHY